MPMSNSLVKINVHLIFHTKYNGTTIAHEDLPRVFNYIGGIVRSIGGMSFIVGGMPDHIHALISVTPTMALADFVRTVKAKSSRWIKGIAPRHSSFAWQEGYGAFSVSPTALPKVINYITNQEEHHRYKSMSEEMEMFIKAYNIGHEEEQKSLQ